jgi:hypothetical protein
MYFIRDIYVSGSAMAGRRILSNIYFAGQGIRSQIDNLGPPDSIASIYMYGHWPRSADASSQIFILLAKVFDQK